MQIIWAETALLPIGWTSNVLIKIDAAGRISKVQPNAPRGGTQVAMLSPAPVNVHSHAQFVNLHQAAAAALTSMPVDTQIGIAPHSLRAVGVEDLKSYNALFPTDPIHMHLAEQVAEVQEVQSHWGMRPVEWALESMGLDQRWCLIHCTQMTPNETVELAKSGAVAGLFPITESNLGDGIFDAVRWDQNGGWIAIESDSNIRISLSEELRTLDYSQRLRDGTRAALATPEQSTGSRMFEGMLQGGAQAARDQIVAAYKRTIDAL